MAPEHLAICAITAASLAGVLLRPWHWPEAVWASAGALALVAAGLLPLQHALHAVGRGTDVYLFLIGMMLLAALARREGLFDALAARCVRRAAGSGPRLFALIYALGVLVTVFLSNDATAVVLTPAVLAACRKAKAPPLPHLLACALVANAASFVLPISNPANLVVFGDRLPPLPGWLAQFALPSVLAIGATFGVLRLLHRRAVAEPIATDVPVPALTPPGRLALGGMLGSAGVLLTASAMGAPLGWPTLLAAAAASAAVLAAKREAPWALAGQVSWGIVPLVGGLFVLVEAMRAVGVVDALAPLMRQAAANSSAGAAWTWGAGLAYACNALNNLPAGLLAGAVADAAVAPSALRGAIAIGIDLGPNLTVTGSLATILWLAAIRREGAQVSAWQFLKVGLVAMPVALGLALAALALQQRVFG